MMGVETIDPRESMARVLDDLPKFIEYLIETREDEWQIDVVRNRGNTKNCLFGHLVNFVYGRDHEGNISLAWDMFEEMWTTTYVVYPINDGQNPKYQQSTPKQRCIAYMKNLWLGLEEPVWSAMERYEAEAKARMAARG